MKISMSDTAAINTEATAIDIRRAQKYGNLITISAIVTFPSAPVSGTTLFTVADYRPSGADTQPMVTYTGGTYGAAFATINSAGVVTIQGAANHIYNNGKLALPD